METLQSTIFIEFDVNTKKITFLRNDNIIDYDSDATSIYARVKYKNLSGNTVYLTPSELENYKFSLYTIKPATNNVNVITGEVTDELKENVYGGVVKFEIPRACTNRLGIVKCEIHINQGNKIIGSSTFVLDVKQSLVTAFDDELLGDEDFPVLRQLILEIQKDSNIDDNNRSKITSYSSDKVENIKENLSSQIKERASNSDLEVERQRINNLMALPEGATINDARLEDVCISNDGIKFSSPGNAVREKENMNRIAAKMGYTTYSHIDNGAWEIGGFSGDNGLPAIIPNYPTQRLRNNEFIPENIKRIVANDGFEFTLYTYKKSDNSFFCLQDFYPTTFVQHFDLLHDLKYKIVVRKTDNSDISIDDTVNILFLTEDDLNNNMKNSLENVITNTSLVKVSDWVYGAIEGGGKLGIYTPNAYSRIATQNFLPTDVVRVVAPEDYELALVKYDLSGDYIDFVKDPNIKSSIRILEEGYLYKVVLNRKDLGKMSIDEANKVMFFNKSIETNFKYPSTIIVAASNSSYKNKLIANYICDGANDEVEIQKAINAFGVASGQVILCNGNYSIDSLYDAGGNAGKFGLYITNPNNNHNVIIKGVSHPNRTSSTGVGVAPTIFLNKTVYDNLSNDEKVTLLGVLPSDTTNSTKVYPAINLTIENLAINIPGNQKAITMVSGEFASNMQIDYLLCSITGNPEYWVENNVISTRPNKNCIGIRLLPGQNFGTGFSVRNCFVWGMNVAYDIGGEHLIMENCGCRLCNISFRFNAYENEAKMSHPNTLINCCEESCKSSMYFCTSTVKQSINIIDYNMEIRNNEGIWGRENLAIEETPGSFRGTITFLANREDYINTDDIEFWQPGSGLHFQTRNLAAKLYGTTQERPAKPNIGQDYFDTTINKAIKFINNKWIDCMGNEV